MAAMKANGIRAIDLVVCNLYPFEATVQQAGVTFEEVIEQIDILDVPGMRAGRGRRRPPQPTHRPDEDDRQEGQGYRPQSRTDLQLQAAAAALVVLGVEWIV